MRPFCFVLMPFGVKTDDTGRQVNFDQVYAEIIEPAIRSAGLEPIRADHETTGGIIHKAMFERLMLCDYAVADLTGANANVFYELGIRHGIRPHSTVLIFAHATRLPFDVAPLRGLPYGLDAHGGPATPAQDRDALAARLQSARTPEQDSPLFQLLSDYKAPDIARLKTDRFREAAVYSNAMKHALHTARQTGRDAVAAIEAGLTLHDTDPAILIDLFLSYRAVEAFTHMADLVPRLPPLVANTVMVREQLGFALNRLNRRDEAEAVLTRLIAEHGPSSETNGILGRVYKDRWGDAKAAGDMTRAKGYLKKAIDTYLAGFEADWRDAYPGINAVTLMEMCDPLDPRQRDLVPVVRYAATQRITGKQPDYWDHATLLELAVLARDQDGSEKALADALILVREPWEPKSTARNLGMIRESRENRGEETGWIKALEGKLLSGGP